MRLKTFSASSMSDALKMVKEHFGEEAIIVSSQKAEIGLGVQVTAAVDTETEPPTKFNNDISNRPSDIDEKLSSILSGQGVLPKIIDEILNVCSTLGLDDIYTSLASSIDQIINFKQENRKTFFIHPSFGIPLRDIRAQFGLKSTYFNTEQVGDKILFNGKGFGHGVGLCQEGAMNMIKRGYSHADVLKYYFTGAKISNYRQHLIYR